MLAVRAVVEMRCGGCQSVAARWQLAGGRQKEARAGARVPGWRGTAGADRQQKEHQGTRSGSAEGIQPARGRGLGEEAARG
jgi:hypothetical protein